MGTSGATLEASDLIKLRDEGIVHGLAEMMNFPGVIAGSEPMLAKLRAFAGRPVDGHSPAVMGKALNAYVSAGIGSDHESVAVAEAAEKLSRGMYILIREATNARNLRALLPLVTPANSRRICFCTDDRQPADLLGVGSVDHMVREAINFGIDPITAIRMATLNPAEWFGLRNVGAIAPGRRADLFIFDQLDEPRARSVFQAGRLVAEQGKMLPSISVAFAALPASLTSSCRIAWERVNFQTKSTTRPRVRVIGSVEDHLVTDELALDARAANGQLVADVSRDILKIAVIERHRASGNVGLAFIKGIGLKRGAIAGTVAHDHHNLVTIGCDDESMLTAARAVAAMGGGLVVAADGDRVLASLALPVAGLMSDRPIDEVRAAYEQLLAACKELGSPLHDPFMAMSFMALEVIPKLKLTDQGLVDVTRFAFTDLFV
jgi:adenine deaminase